MSCDLSVDLLCPDAEAVLWVAELVVLVVGLNSNIPVETVWSL